MPFGVFVLVKDFLGVVQQQLGGCNLWATGLRVLVRFGYFELAQGQEGLGHVVQPHSPHSQPGLPGRVKAGVRRMIVAVGFYSDQGSCRQFLAPWSGVWMKEQGIQRGFGQGRSELRAGEGVRVEVGENISGVQVSYEDLWIFQCHEQEGAPCQRLSPNDVSAWEGILEWWGRHGWGESHGSLWESGH